MKKRLALYLIIPLITIGVFSYNSSHAVSIQNGDTNDSPSLSQDSKGGSYQDALKTLLMHYIDKAIDEFYGQYLTYTPMENPWSVEFISLEQTGFKFLIKLNVQPYIGPHNSVGIDCITFEIDASGKVTVKNFEHVKSFPIAPNYHDIIKKWPPPENAA